MGDRRNVVVEFDDNVSVALYTHWTGTDLPGILADAMSRGMGRWDDPTYLTRIIFSEMIQDAVLSETGYGIEPIKTGSDNYCESSPGYDPYVDIRNQRIGLDETWYSFPEYIEEFGG